VAEYTIGEVEGLTGLKAHVLRYWEESVPFIRPRKDDRGRRVYSSRDVELITRVKRLVQEEKYTLEGAGERLMQELTGEASHAPTAPGASVSPGDPAAADGAEAPKPPANPDPTREALDALRAELTDLYRMVKKAGKP